MTPEGLRKLCKHCGLKHVQRPRGLCWHCWADPDIREQHPNAETKVFGPDGYPVAFCRCRTCGGAVATTKGDLQNCSTCVRPEAERAGFFARIAEYARRAEARQPLCDGRRVA